jgi:hypothetical protein
MAGRREGAGQVAGTAADFENAGLGRKLREDDALKVRGVGCRSDQPIL